MMVFVSVICTIMFKFRSVIYTDVQDLYSMLLRYISCLPKIDTNLSIEIRMITIHRTALRTPQMKVWYWVFRLKVTE